ncbi:MAG: CHAT domain-containing tetratricopeptide repeat protein [Acidobacteriota bacterium]
MRIAKAAEANLDWSVARQALDEAQNQAEASGQAAVLAVLKDSRAQFLRDRNELERARTMYREAWKIRQTISPSSLATATSLTNLGSLAFERGDLAAAEAHHQGALAITKQVAPRSLAVATSLHYLGRIEASRSDLASAQRLFHRSLSLQEQLTPPGLDAAQNLNGLGYVAWQRGDLVAAEDFFRRSLSLREELAPQSLSIPKSLNNLGAIAFNRGDLVAAESYFRRSLEIKQESAAPGLSVAFSLHNLGSVASALGDHRSAESYLLRSLAIREKLAPQSLDVAMSLNNLGKVLFDQEDLAVAESYLQRALAIYSELAPQSIDSAETLSFLGDIALARSDSRSAEAYYQHCLRIRQQRVAGTADEAAACQRLGVLYRRRGELARAASFYDCAVAALEAQRSKLGGSAEARGEFSATVASTYREAIDLTVELRQPEKAFHLLERYRAREFVNLLSERDLVFSSDLPEDLENRRRNANRTYDQAFGRWMRLSDRAPAEERQIARLELETARRIQDEIRAEVRTAAPRLAALRDPQPLGLAAARASLDPGTLLLSYSIGRERSHLFATEPEGGDFLVVPLPIGEDALRREVKSFREILGQGHLDRRPERTLLAARRLSSLLLTPVAAAIRRAERILILADGPLHSLPFAALSDPDLREGGFLVETKPLFRAASATAFALQKPERRPPRPLHLTAFGDPSYPTKSAARQSPASPLQASAPPRLRAAVRRGLDLTSLPATREEVENLRRLFPDNSRIFLGAAATEERAKSVGRETTHLHIASHGLLDDRSPLDSALALSIPQNWSAERDNGLLQAWEIFEQVRLDADLVTLSACDTGLGKVLGGEGLHGLTRAFQYAGARSVLASLWSVSDRSTAELMRHFYRYLGAGRSKAEALRHAQLDLLHNNALSHPFHWAGFELVGDWR